MNPLELLPCDPGPAQGAWALPHHGQRGPSCREWSWRIHVAAAKAHHNPYQVDCKRFDCPVCRSTLDERGDVKQAAGWEHREAQRIERRLARLMPEGRKAIHVVFSPDPLASAALLRSDPVHGLAKLRKRAVHVLRRWGMRGGVLVFHYFRVPGRFNERDCSAEGPHFHAIGDGWIVPPDDFKRSRDVVRNLGVRRSIYSTGLYVLSHATRFALPSETRTAPTAGPSPAVGLQTLQNESETSLGRTTAGPSPAVGDACSAPGRLVAADSPQPPQPRSSSSVVGTPALGPGTRLRYATQAVTWFGSLSYNKAPLQRADVAESYLCRVCCTQISIDEWMQGRWVRKRDPPLQPGISELDSWSLRPLARVDREAVDDRVVEAMLERSVLRRRRGSDALEAAMVF